MFSKELVSSTSSSIVLLTLMDSESYGYEIIQKIKSVSDNNLTWKDGMLYPLLHKLEKKRLIESKWMESKETGKKRKYYSLTAEGLTFIKEEKKQWLEMYSIMEKLWRSKNV